MRISCTHTLNHLDNDGQLWAEMWAGQVLNKQELLPYPAFLWIHFKEVCCSEMFTEYCIYRVHNHWPTTPAERNELFRF